MKKPEISTRQRIEAVRAYRLEAILAEDQAAKAAAAKAEEARQKQNEYNRKYREMHKDDPEYLERQRAIHREYNQRKRADPEYREREKQKARERAAKKKQPEAEERTANYEAFISSAPTDPAINAAIINERIGRSTICAVCNRGRNVIVEHMHRQFTLEENFRPYRIKITQYLYYDSMEDVRKWAEKEKIKLQEFGDYNGTDDA